MLELVTFTATPCKMAQEAEYGIHCPAGMEAGTPVPAFPW
jgi:hypothetical protein